MNRRKTMKIMMVCLAVLVLGTIILLANRLRSNYTNNSQTAEVPVETPTEAPVQTPTEVPVQTPTEVPVQTPTEVPVQTPTEVPGEKPSTAPTREVTKEPTEEPQVSLTPTPEEGGFEEVEDNIFISADKVNLRAEASSTSEIVAEVSKNTLLKRTGIAAKWSRVKYKSQTCYVSNQFITDQIPMVTPSDSDSQN